MASKDEAPWNLASATVGSSLTAKCRQASVAHLDLCGSAMEVHSLLHTHCGLGHVQA